MAKASAAVDKRINRRSILKAGAALAATGPALLRGGHAEAQPQSNPVRPSIAYVGAWTHEQLLEVVNPSFLTLDQAQRFLYAVHADLEEVSAYVIDKQNGRITALNKQS